MKSMTRDGALSYLDWQDSDYPSGGYIKHEQYPVIAAFSYEQTYVSTIRELAQSTVRFMSEEDEIIYWISMHGQFNNYDDSFESVLWKLLGLDGTPSSNEALLLESSEDRVIFRALLEHWMLSLGDHSIISKKAEFAIEFTNDSVCLLRTRHESILQRFEDDMNVGHEIKIYKS